jgi:hypothetical protein
LIKSGLPAVSSIDPSTIRGEWEVFEITPDYRRSRIWLDPERTKCVVRTEHLASDDLIAANQQSLHESQGQRFGDGKIVGRIPMNMLYSPKYQIAAKLKEGDKDHIKWILNSEDFRPFRTFRGRI